VAASHAAAVAAIHSGRGRPARVGGSAPSVAGYAAVDLAEDVHLLIDGLNLGQAHVVGHDVGGWVAYAFARRFPDSTRTVMILETPIPGIEPWLHLDVDVPLWHGAFHMVPGLPEALVTGRQAVYFRYFFDVGTKDNGVISDADVEHYADAYGDPDRLRSAFEIYRAVPANMTYNAGQTDPIDIPCCSPAASTFSGRYFRFSPTICGPTTDGPTSRSISLPTASTTWSKNGQTTWPDSSNATQPTDR
jgi:pimeloyl-ACP methyl ester carboxylesterase